jgi:hypothetical protein
MKPIDLRVSEALQKSSAIPKKPYFPKYAENLVHKGTSLKKEYGLRTISDKISPFIGVNIPNSKPKPQAK